MIGTPAWATYDCGNPPPGITTIVANTSYVDEHHSIVDPKLAAENAAHVKPLNDFMETVSRAADAYVATKDKSAAQCALVWLNRWAVDGALLDKPVSTRGMQAIYESNGLLAGLSLAYLKVQPEATPVMSSNINQWLTKLAFRSVEYIKKNRKGNNHEYWAALGVLVTGVVSDNREFIQISSEVYDDALDSIQDDGTLPKELARGQMAMTYHGFACAPLVIMAEVARKSGMDWYARRDHRLSLLAEKVVTSLNDPAWFEKQTGIKQKSNIGRNLAWLELYRRVTVHPEKIHATLVNRPYYRSIMGGNLTYLAEIDFFAPPAKTTKKDQDPQGKSKLE